MSQWYLSHNGQQFGPLDASAARAKAREIPGGHCWREGFAGWRPIAEIDELTGAGAMVPSPPHAPPPIRGADLIDFRIHGSDMQFVEVELDPGESVVAEAGALMYKDPVIGMETVFGDGSQGRQGGGFLDVLVGAGKRLLTGESLFITAFTHNGGGGKARLAFASPYPGTIIPMQLGELGGRLVCQKDAFLCAARGVSIGIQFQRKILTGLFGGEGFIMQKLEGDGLVFVHAGGTIVERQLAAGERLDVDTGCVVALEQTVDFDVKPVGGVKSILFGGEGVFLANLTGPGRVWLQSLPFSRMAGRILAAAPQRGGSREEGSVIGGIGLGALLGSRNE